MSTPDPGLTAALLKISEFAERLALAEATMGGLIDGVADVRELVEEHQKLLEKTSKLLAKLLPPDKPDGPEDPPYVIAPSIHWWSIDPDGRTKAVEHLRSWVEHVYRPHYGHLAAMLAPCWTDHELCLIHIDVISELHSAVYFSKRTAPVLNAQAEFNVRILPATADLMRHETSKCNHRAAANGSKWRGAQ